MKITQIKKYETFIIDLEIGDVFKLDEDDRDVFLKLNNNEYHNAFNLSQKRLWTCNLNEPATKKYAELFVRDFK